MAESPTGPSEVDAVLRYVEQVAPPDVVATIDWLESQGWLVQCGRGGGDESFGDAMVELGNEDARITIVRHKSQWLMDIQPAGWKSSVDLDVVVDAIAGREDWSGPAPHSLPGQLPPGIAWRDALPTVLAWLASTPDAERSLREMMRRRGRSLFGPRRRLGITKTTA